MIRARHVGSVIGLFAMVILVAAGCRQDRLPPQTPAPPPPPPAAAPRHRRRRRRRRRRPRAAPKPAPLTEEQIFAQKSLDQLNAERPLADVFFDSTSRRSATTRGRRCRRTPTG